MWEECDHCFCYSNMQKGLENIFKYWRNFNIGE